MTPLDPESFWSIVLRPYIDEQASPQVRTLVQSVDALFTAWRDLFGATHELQIAYQKSYSVDIRPLTRTAGLIQIRDYAVQNEVKSLLMAWALMQDALKDARDEFYRLLTAKSGLNYFGAIAEAGEGELAVPEKTRFDKVLCRRLAVAGLLVRDLHADPSFGRTKLAKLFYLADANEDLGLETHYAREAAGPLDQRALYNQRIGIEALAQKYRFFQPEISGKMVRYQPLEALKHVDRFSAKHLGAKVERIRVIASALKHLTTEQSEIIATLFACWNDFLIHNHSPTDDEIITEFLLHWHVKKGRFSRGRLKKALSWMQSHARTPSGRGNLTSVKESGINC
jgi:hypothetical protein